MANRRPMNNRRNDFGRNERGQGYGQARPGVSPWQGSAPSPGLNSLLPLGGNSTEATLALANNLITNLLQTRQNAVPSLLDMPIRRDFGPPDMGRFDRGGYAGGPNRMGNQGNFRRTGTYNRAGDRMNHNRKPFRPNDGHHRQQNRNSQKQDDSKAKPNESAQVKTENTQEDNKDKKEGGKSTGSRYDVIPAKFLRCHICKATMWDGRSFENHLNGKAHSIMMQKTAESYALTADMMRQEFKIREMKHTRKQGHQQPMDFYCAMCDMYALDGASHRPTVGHRKLKKYLHPSCLVCQKEMPTRIELDEHRLTVEHLSRRPVTADKKDKTEAQYLSTLYMEQANVGHVPRHIKEEPTEGEKAVPDDDKLVLDFKEGDEVATITLETIPKYSPERDVGPSFLEEYKCVRCTLCNRLMDSEETAAVHLKTRKHHQMFVRMLREKAGIKNQDGNKRTMSSGDNNPEAKRRRTDTEGNNEHDNDEDIKEEAEEDWDADNAEEHEENGVSETKKEDWDANDDGIREEDVSNGGKDDTAEESAPMEDKQDNNEVAESEKVEEQVAEEEPEPQQEPEHKPTPSTPRTRARGTPRGRRARGRF